MNTCANHSKAVETATPERATNKASISKRGKGDPKKVVAEKIRRTLELRERRKAMTLGLYSLKCKDGRFGLPFCAVSDHFALLAQKQLLPLSDCYYIGSVCLYDGAIVPHKPTIVLDKGVNHG